MDIPDPGTLTDDDSLVNLVRTNWPIADAEYKQQLRDVDEEARRWTSRLLRQLAKPDSISEGWVKVRIPAPGEPPQEVADSILDHVQKTFTTLGKQSPNPIFDYKKIALAYIPPVYDFITRETIEGWLVLSIKPKTPSD